MLDCDCITNHTTTRCIPRPTRSPSTLRTSLRAAMRLRHDHQSFRNATAVLLNLCHDILDERLPLKHQDPHKLELLFEMAIEANPLFKRYEEAWPIEQYLYHHLRTKTSKYSRQQFF
ncbi:hypothetical protein AcV7_007958 [Taiwanofungus camphoratus]|nr:hypothetical protein AcW2_006754 [Antrodia cinnamomea]KAI0952030.1 hypothetical protein AcV7_007958 [Antrodia cinnamomea]